MKFPYAVRDFYALITEGYLYFDRTDRIPVIESLGKELLFLRPRRFGKSLWLSTLMNYYDILKADKFAALFGKLAIGQNPTPLHNQYFIMKWDFSQIKSHGTVADIEQALHNHINAKIKNFFVYYRSMLQAQSDINPTDSLASFDTFLGLLHGFGHKLYLFIDEYDNFANEVMMGKQGNNLKRYSDLIQGEGLFKTLFKNVKSAGSGEGLARVFMTGVSPIVMNDITSGSNVTTDISWHPWLNDLCGFRQEEVQGMVQAVVDSRGLSTEQGAEAMEMMRIFYDGSRFVLSDFEEAVNLYNPILTFYFLQNLHTLGRYPQNMLDSNLAPDYHKLVYISNHPAGKKLLMQALNTDEPLSVTGLGDRFGIEEMLDPDKQYERLASLLCYLGALTVTGVTDDAEEILEIPNLVMRKLYAERILALALPQAATRDLAQAATKVLFSYGDIAPLCRFVEEYYLSVYDNRDYKSFNELTLKTLFLALLHYKQVYIMDSEPALRRTYGDLIMLLRPEMRHFSLYDLLVEFKYVPLDKLIIDEKKLSGQAVREMSEEALMAIKVVDDQFEDAKRQLRGYQQVLTQKYGDILKLRTYAIVSVGLERLLWVEVK